MEGRWRQKEVIAEVLGKRVEVNTYCEALGKMAALCLPRDQKLFLFTPSILAMASKDQVS